MLQDLLQGPARTYVAILIFAFWGTLGITVIIRLLLEAYRYRTPYSMSLWVQLATVFAEVAVAALALYWLASKLP